MTAGDQAITGVLERAWQAPFYRRRWGRLPSATGMAALASCRICGSIEGYRILGSCTGIERQGTRRASQCQ